MCLRWSGARKAAVCIMVQCPIPRTLTGMCVPLANSQRGAGPGEPGPTPYRPSPVRGWGQGATRMFGMGPQHNNVFQCHRPELWLANSEHHEVDDDGHMFSRFQPHTDVRMTPWHGDTPQRPRGGETNANACNQRQYRVWSKQAAAGWRAPVDQVGERRTTAVRAPGMEAHPSANDATHTLHRF